VVIYCITAVLTFVNFIAFLVSRSNPWVHNPGRAWQMASLTEFRDYPASEFERVLSCYAIFSCQRAGSALFVQPLIFLSDLLAKAYYWNLDAEARIFIIQTIGLGWRALCIGLFAFAFFYLTRSISLSLFFVNALLFSISGVWLRVFGEFVKISPFANSPNFKSRAVLAFQDFPHEQLFSYDYTNFIALAIVISLGALHKQTTNLKRLFVVSFLLTSLFEFFGFIFAVSLLLLNFRSENRFAVKNSAKQILAVLFGSVVWITMITIYFYLVRSLRPQFYALHGASASSHRTGDLIWAIKNPIENLTKNPSIFFQVFLTLTQSACCGFLLGRLSRLLKTHVKLDPRDMDSLLFALIANSLVQVIVLFVTYGVNGMAGEHSRQTVGLQIALFTYVFMRNVKFSTVKKFAGAST